MAVETLFRYDSSLEYILSSTQVSQGQATLVLSPGNVSTTDAIDTSVGYTFDPAKIEFISTKFYQKSQLSAQQKGYINYDTKDMTWINAPLAPPIGTLVGGATVSGGRLDATGGTTKYAEYSAGTACNTGPVGCVRLTYTPNYTGFPVGDRSLFSRMDSSGSLVNAVVIFHKGGTGFLFARLYNSSGALITQLSPVWSPTSGQAYEIEFGWDVTTGNNRLFIDGVEVSSNTITGTVGTSATLMRVGCDQSVGSNSDGYFDDVITFDQPQHNSNYTPGEAIPQFKYLEASVTGPPIDYSGPGVATGYVQFSSPGLTGVVQFILNGLYWNGSAWVTSDGTFAQSNTQSTIQTNITTLPYTGSVTVNSVFANSNAASPALDQLQVVFLGQLYSLDGTVKTVAALAASSISSFSSISTKPGTTDIKFAFEVNGQLKYWNGSAWVNSDGTFAQTNDDAAIVANIATLLSTNSAIKVFAYLKAATPYLESPSLDTVQIGYIFNKPNLEEPWETVTWGFIRDSKNDPISGAEVRFSRNISSNRVVEVDSHLVSNDQVVTNTDADGEFSVPLVPGQYKLTISKGSDFIISKNALGETLLVTIPKQYEVNITDQI